MKTLPGWLVLMLLIAAAIICYFVGFIAGFGLFLGLGVLFEFTFWVKLFKRRQKNRYRDATSTMK